MFLKLLICSHYICGFNGQSFTWSNFELTDFQTQKETKRGHRASNWDARGCEESEEGTKHPWEGSGIEEQSWLRYLGFFLSPVKLLEYVSLLSLLKYRNKHIYVYICVCVCVCMYICIMLWKNLEWTFCQPNIDKYIYTNIKFIHIWLDSNLFYIYWFCLWKIKYMIMSKSSIFKLKILTYFNI